LLPTTVVIEFNLLFPETSNVKRLLNEAFPFKRVTYLNKLISNTEFWFTLSVTNVAAPDPVVKLVWSNTNRIICPPD